MSATSASESEYISTRRVGEARVSIINDGTLPWAPRFPAPEPAWRRAMPEADARGRVALALNVALVRLPGATILIDPGCDDPTSAWERGFEAEFPGASRTPGLAAGLGALGVAPGEVTHVLITHAHGDHFAGVMVERDGRLVPRFPNARHLIGRRDWEENPTRHQPDSALAMRLGPIAELGRVELVEDEREIVPGVTMLAAPGETPGHCIVRLRSSGATWYYLGDLFHHACEVTHLDWVPPGRDTAAMRRSRQRVLAEAVPARALLVTTHQRFPPWGRIVPAGAVSWWERA